MSSRARLLRGFFWLWLGQVGSLLGSAMTRFALAVYIWDKTGEATPVVLITVTASLSALLTNLVAGVLVDRWNRKLVLIFSDLGAGLATLLLVLGSLFGDIQFWQIYLAVALSGVCNSFHYLAFSTSTSLLVDKEDYARVSGMMSVAEYVTLVGGPLLAGVLIAIIGIRGIWIIDIVTFLFAISVVALTYIPQPQSPTAESEAQDSDTFLQQMTFGFRYIFKRKALLGLVVLVFSFNAIESLGYTLLAPMILARTAGDETTLGAVQAAMGIGGIIGGVLISVWGGPKHKMLGLLIGIICTGLMGDALMGLGQMLMVWLIAGFCLEIFIPLVVSSNRAIWQSKVPLGLQGRIFATITFVSTAAEPLSALASGLLADHIFEPAMRPGGALTAIFGQVVGTGAGAGMALLFVLSGTLLGIMGIAALFIPTLTQLEIAIPDYDQVNDSAR